MSRMTGMTTGAVSAMAGITTGTQAHGQILGPQAHGEILGTQAHGQATVVASPVVHGQATVVASHVVHVVHEIHGSDCDVACVRLAHA